VAIVTLLFPVPDTFSDAIMAAVASFAGENVATHPLGNDLPIVAVKIDAPAVGVVPVVNIS
jgi:hypothetical protein